MPSRLRNVAVCLHTSPGGFSAQVSRGIARFVGERNDWSIFLRPLAGSDLEKALRTWHGDGVICAVNNEQNQSFAMSLEVPVVNVTGMFTSTGVPSVLGEDEAVGRMAAEHFISRGFRSFACLTYSRAHYARRRLEGFSEAVAGAGRRLNGTLDVDEPAPPGWANRLERIGRWLHDMPRPVGVFAVFDTIGHLVIQACRHADLHVPEEMAVLGVDNDHTWCELSNPPLSSISQDFDRRGYMAAELLHRLMDGEAPPDEPIHVPPASVVVRRSTDIFATDDEAVRAALRFIHQHGNEQLRVGDVAAAVHMSRRNIERRFREALGRTVYEEIRHTRLATARSLLTRTEKPLMEVALDSGFGTASDLSNAFRRHLGMTPTQYRQRHRQQA